MDKKADTKPKLQSYIVKLQVLVPMEYQFVLQAESPAVALEMAQRMQPNVKRPTGAVRKLAAKVFRGATNLIELTKSY